MLYLERSVAFKDAAVGIVNFDLQLLHDLALRVWSHQSGEQVLQLSIDGEL